MDSQQPLGNTRVVLWDPNGSNHFVVGGGSELKMYEWNEQKAEVRHIGLKSDPQAIPCFTWSPHTIYNDFFAIGRSSGAVDLCRMNEGISTTPAALMATQTVITLSISKGNRRPSTCLAFCNLNANLLANGLEKFRTEPSLVVWDVAQSASIFEASIPDEHFDKIWSKPAPFASAHSVRLQHPPVPGVRSASSAASTVMSLATRTPDMHFSRDSSVKGATTPANKRPIQDTTHPFGQYCQADAINSCAFLPHSPSQIIAGVNGRLLRVYDVRSQQTKAVMEAATRAVRGLCCDPMEGYRVAGFDEAGVQVWDIRRPGFPILSFQEEDAGLDTEAKEADGYMLTPGNQITGVEFCNTRRGVIGTTTRDGHYVRLWDVIDENGSEYYQISGDNFSERDGTGTTESVASQRHDERTTTSESVHSQDQFSQDNAPCLAGTRRSKLFSKAVASFAFIPGSVAPSSAPHVVAVSKSGDIELAVIRDAPRHTWSSRGDLVASIGRRFKVYNTHGGIDGDPPREPWDIVSHSPERVHQELKEEKEQAEESVQGQIPKKDDHLTVVGLDRPRKISPASMMRIPAERKSNSPFSTPRAVAVPLDSEEADTKSSDPSKPSLDLSKSRVEGAVTPKDTNSRSRPRSILGRSRSEKKTAERNLPLDISAVMRSRVLQGYSLENARHNSELVRDDQNSSLELLSDIWLWLHTSNKVLQGDGPLTHIHGFDFTLKGVLSIWEGFEPLHRRADQDVAINPQYKQSIQQHSKSASALSATAPRINDRKFGNYIAALDWLNRRNSRRGISVPKSSKKPQQRLLGLSLVGWGYSDEELDGMIAKWEKEGNSGQAACWSLFLNKTDKAIDILSRSKDERHRLLSGTVAGLVIHMPSDSASVESWRSRCQKLAARLDDPYARMLLTWLVTRDWEETIQDEPISLFEKLAIALRFFEDQELTNFMRKKLHDAKTHGELDGLILTGINEHGVEILQSYIDQTGDVQTAAIMASLAPQLYVQEKHAPHHRRGSLSTTSASATDASIDGETKANSQHGTSLAIASQVEGWLDAYIELLDRWKLFHHRAQFDIDRGQLVIMAMSPRHPSDVDHEVDDLVNGPVEPVEWVQRQLEVRCQVCGTSIGVSGPKLSPGADSEYTQIAACPKCSKRLPRCSVCRMYLSFAGDPAESIIRNPVLCDTIDESLIFCQTCRHGGHASHILGWFFGASTANGEGRKHDHCPVADCYCRCVDE